MSDVLYSEDEWISALETAEANDFDPVDSEHDGGPLAGWLAEQYTHDKAGQDSDVLEAVIRVLQEVGHDAFSTETYITALDSYRGESVDSFTHLVQEYMDENYAFTGNFPGNPDEADFKTWYLANCRNDSEMYVEVSSGTGFFWFDRSKW